ncbi:MAG: molybdenum cofactor guanylyltransferase [Nitriliruptor sp.]|nr:MAG: molybdenum cofactor guanylyltransferase [Nitriliruptor sp.]
MGDVGIVLVGGRSSRMGAPKAGLEWHGSTLLRRTVGVLRRAVDGPVIIVRAPDQAVPETPDDVLIVDDDQEGLGPLQGLAVGLEAAAAHGEVAFVCSTDLPFLHPAYIRRILAGFDEDTDVVLPMVHGHRQPLAAGYRTSLAAEVQRLLADGARKPAMLFEVVRTRRLDEDALLSDPVLAAADPALRSVLNINDPDDYARARAAAPPTVDVRCFGTLARSGGYDGHDGRPVAAATLEGAARAVGISLDQHVVAALNGDRITRDGHTPLMDGDRVSLLSADAGG